MKHNELVNGDSVFYRHRILYDAARRFLNFCIGSLYYRHTYTIGLDNVPPPGEPVIIVPNHQNALNDALCIVSSLTDRKPSFMARGDIFGKDPKVDKLLRWIGILPVYRMNREGRHTVANNYESFDEAAMRLSEGGTVTIFAEGRQQDGHWLGEFSTGYLRLAFDAAEKTGFMKDISIVPAGIHYSAYNGLRNDLLIRYGEPVHLKPYYEMYRANPSAAKTEVNRIIHDRVRSMILDITDRDNYETVDFLRRSSFAAGFCDNHGLPYDTLPEKLEADKSFVYSLQDPFAADILSEAGKLLEMEKQAKLPDEVFDRKPTMKRVVVEGVILLLLLNLAVICAYPSLICWFVPKAFSKMMRDDRFEGSFVIAANVLVILPTLALVTLLVVTLTSGFLAALLAVAMFPVAILFEWAYCKAVRRWIDGIRYNSDLRDGTAGKIDTLRNVLGKEIGIL